MPSQARPATPPWPRPIRAVLLLPLTDVPEVGGTTPLGTVITGAIERSQIGLEPGDILVVCQKLVSKAEGRVVRLADVVPSAFARQLGPDLRKDPRLIEVVLRETRRIVRMERGHLIVETPQGWVCANAGVDESNAPGDGWVVLLPADPDASAARLHEDLHRHFGIRVPVILTDTFGRPWREGLVEFALGVAGMAPLLDLRGETDRQGKRLDHTVVAVADEIAAAAGLLMEKGAGVPAVLVRGYQAPAGAGGGGQLIRPRETDLFR